MYILTGMHAWESGMMVLRKMRIRCCHGNGWELGMRIIMFVFLLNSYISVFLLLGWRLSVLE